MIINKISAEDIVAALVKNPQYNYLQPAESPYEIGVSKRFSSKMKPGLIIKELLESAPRCPVCQGIVPSQSISVDHKDRVEDGGLCEPDNAQITHPYCNTGYKEYIVAKGKQQPIIPKSLF